MVKGMTMSLVSSVVEWTIQCGKKYLDLAPLHTLLELKGIFFI